MFCIGVTTISSTIPISVESNVVPLCVLPPILNFETFYPSEVSSWVPDDNFITLNLGVDLIVDDEK